MVACIMHGLIKYDRRLLTFGLITISLIQQSAHTEFQAHFQVPMDFNGIWVLSCDPPAPATTSWTLLVRLSSCRVHSSLYSKQIGETPK